MSNKKSLDRLIKAKDARLAPIAPTTVRGHADGAREPSTPFALALYVRLGLPLEGWLSKRELAALEKAAPLPGPCLNCEDGMVYDDHCPTCEHPTGKTCEVCGGDGKQ